MPPSDDGEPADDGRPGLLGDPESAHTGLNDAGAGTDVDPGQSPAATDDDDDGAAAAFALVGNGIRAEILRALGAHTADHGTASTLSFSALRAASDTDVGSSQFNYHLQELVGVYVENVAGGDDGEPGGYRLRPEGKQLYRTLRAGTYTHRDALDPVALDQPCYHCDDRLELAYDDGMFTVQCYGCETLYDLILAPPSAVRNTASVRARVEQYNYHLRQAFAQGVCPTCLHSLSTEFVRPSETGFTDVVERTVYVLRSCPFCGNHSYLSVGSLLLHHPAVVSFCYERGLDVMATPRWALEFAATDRHVAVQSTDPWEVSVTVPVDGDELELVVDDDLTVTERAVSSSPTESAAERSDTGK